MPAGIKPRDLRTTLRTTGDMLEVATNRHRWIAFAATELVNNYLGDRRSEFGKYVVRLRDILASQGYEVD